LSIPDPKSGKVLVLGSGGLIGSAVLRWLKARNYETLEVKNRRHIDLRVPGALDVFNDEPVSFVIFLACEVGGSKFIDNNGKNVQLAIIEHNLLIYQTVIQWIEHRKIPYIFTSSYLQTQPNAYGAVKRLGEAWIKSVNVGRVVRFWNIYGHERIGLKSHVLTDWITQCLQNKAISGRTDGTEPRQFLHADDTANAVGIMMENYDKLDFATDVSSQRWTTLREVAEIIAQKAPHPCPITYTNEKAAARELIAPKTEGVHLYSIWKPDLTLEQGIEGLFEAYTKDVQEGSTFKHHDEL